MLLFLVLTTLTDMWVFYHMSNAVCHIWVQPLNSWLTVIFWSANLSSFRWVTSCIQFSHLLAYWKFPFVTCLYLLWHLSGHVNFTLEFLGWLLSGLSCVMFLECGLPRTGSAVAQLRMYVLHSLPSDLWFVFDLCVVMYKPYLGQVVALMPVGLRRVAAFSSYCFVHRKMLWESLLQVWVSGCSCWYVCVSMNQIVFSSFCRVSYVCEWIGCSISWVATSDCFFPLYRGVCMYGALADTVCDISSRSP